jgi:hypothetical protein
VVESDPLAGRSEHGGGDHHTCRTLKDVLKFLQKKRCVEVERATVFDKAGTSEFLFFLLACFTDCNVFPSRYRCKYFFLLIIASSTVVNIFLF